MPPNRFESEVGNFLEGSHGDRTHIKRADHHTVTPLCGTLLAGKQWEHNGHTFQVWLIPAHAGKTCPTRGDTAPTRAHPRSRGENKDGAGAALIRWGSSPLTRGKRL